MHEEVGGRGVLILFIYFLFLSIQYNNIRADALR